MCKGAIILFVFVLISCKENEKTNKYVLLETNSKDIHLNTSYLIRKDNVLYNESGFTIINEQVYLNDSLTSYGKGKYLVEYSNQSVNTVNLIKDFEGFTTDTLKNILFIRKDTSWEVLANYEKYPPTDLLELKNYKNTNKKAGNSWELLQVLKVNPSFKNKYIYDNDFKIIEIEYYRDSLFFKFGKSISKQQNF